MSNNNLRNSVLNCFLKFDMTHYDIFSHYNSNFINLVCIEPNFDVCSICFSFPKKPDRGNTCSHIFWYKCLHKWFTISRRCPYCRKQFNKICII